MPLPRGESSIIPEGKVELYCLNPTHGRGGAKARVFASALGLTSAHAALLKTGERGTIVMKFDEQNFLVEFSDDQGVEYAMPTLGVDEIDVVWRIADMRAQAGVRKAAG